MGNSVCRPVHPTEAYVAHDQDEEEEPGSSETAPRASWRVVARVAGGFALQLLSVYTSISIFVKDTSYLWTGMAITDGLLFNTPAECRLERFAHVFSGGLAYYLLDFHYERFPTGLTVSVALCNALGCVVGEHCFRRAFPRTPLARRDIEQNKFLGALMLFPVFVGSLAASVPGSVAFRLFFGANLWKVFVNYTVGHISGTTVVLYPTMVLPALYRSRQPIQPAMVAGLAGVVLMFAFTDYGVFAFAAILGAYGSIVTVSTQLDQWSACLMGAVSAALMLGLTVGGRGPFNSVCYFEEGARNVILSTQLATTVATGCSAFVSISSTRLRKLQAREKASLERAEKMIETQTVQLCKVGHDMLNNTTFIWGVTESLVDTLSPTGEATSQLKTIQAAIAMNGTLVKDMVDSFKPEGHGRPVRRAEVDVQEMADLHVHFAKALVRMAGKSIETALDTGATEGEFKVFTDRDRLHQILSNLVGNAVKYTKSGTIVLRVSRQDDAGPTGSIILQVIDTGIGIDEEDIPKVFGTLFRTSRGAQVAPGSGLGLSSVVDLCKLLGAKVDVASPGMDKGTTLTLELPIGTDPTKTNAVDADVEWTPPSTGFRPLVVDDSLVIREMMKRCLIRLGCDVTPLASGEKAKEHLVAKGSAIDVVITDMYMGQGRCTGADLISDIRRGRLRGVSKNVPCILCSGREVQMEEFGDNTLFVWKPFSETDVSHALKVITQRTASNEKSAV
ncbi:unnamed protein product [Ectocarpus fasciculatus]